MHLLHRDSFAICGEADTSMWHWHGNINGQIQPEEKHSEWKMQGFKFNFSFKRASSPFSSVGYLHHTFNQERTNCQEKWKSAIKIIKVFASFKQNRNITRKGVKKHPARTSLFHSGRKINRGGGARYFACMATWRMSSNGRKWESTLWMPPS